MQRTIYRNRFVVDEVFLNNTEASKIVEILSHHEVLGDSGIVSGFLVEPESAIPGTLQITPGTGVLPNRELVKISIAQRAVQLSDSTNLVPNIVTIAYSESLSEPRVSLNGSADNLVFADVVPEVRVYTPSQFALLSSDALRQLLVIAIVIASGTGVAISNGNIFRPQEEINIIDFNPFEILKGVIIRSTNVSPNPNLGSLRYNIQSGLLSFISPNNPSPPPLDAGGSLPVIVDLNAREPVTVTLVDPSTSPTDSLTVDIYGSSFPKNFSSFEANRLQSLIDAGRVNGNYINENIALNGIYSQGLTEITDGIVVETKKQSPIDRAHREMIGTGITSRQNPHGLSLEDITRLFDSIPGNFRIGDELLSTPEEAEFPRMPITVSDKSKYTLFFESILPNEGSQFVTPARIYLGLNTIFVTVNAKYDPYTDIWVKDNSSFTSVPAIKVQISLSNFNISFNTTNTAFSDVGGWNPKILTDTDQVFLRESLAIVPRSNDEHNDTSSNLFSALINVVNPTNRKTPFYEDRNATDGGLRIYMGRDFSRSSGDNVIEFTHNARNREDNTSTWEKDSFSDPSYVFRFRWRQDLNQLDVMESLIYTDPFSSFNDSSFTIRPFTFPGGFKNQPTNSNTTPPPFETGITVVSGGFLRYENPVTKRRIVSLSDYGFRSATSLSLGLNTRFDTGESPADQVYMRHDNSDVDVMDRGIPYLIQIENIDKLQNQSFVPKFTWRGTPRPWYKANTEAANDSGADVGFPGTKDIPDINQGVTGTVHKITIPLLLEESEVTIKKMTIPFDWFLNGDIQAFDNGFNPQGFVEQEFTWDQGLDPSNRWFNFNLVAVNYRTGATRSVNPDLVYAAPPIVWLNEDESTLADRFKVIRFRDTAGGSLFTYRRSDFAEDEFLQLQIETDRTYLDNTDRIYNYRPFIVGNLFLEYETQGLE